MKLVQIALGSSYIGYLKKISSVVAKNLYLKFEPFIVLLYFKQKFNNFSYQSDSLLGHVDPEDLSSDLSKAWGRPATLPWSCRNLLNRWGCSEFWESAGSKNKASPNSKTLTTFPSELFILSLLLDWVYVEIFRLFKCCLSFNFENDFEFELKTNFASNMNNFYIIF